MIGQKANAGFGSADLLNEALASGSIFIAAGIRIRL